MRDRHAPDQEGGFSLVELIVVVGIIATPAAETTPDHCVTAPACWAAARILSAVSLTALGQASGSHDSFGPRSSSASSYAYCSVGVMVHLGFIFYSETFRRINELRNR